MSSTGFSAKSPELTVAGEEEGDCSSARESPAAARQVTSNTDVKIRPRTLVFTRRLLALLMSSLHRLRGDTCLRTAQPASIYPAARNFAANADQEKTGRRPVLSAILQAANREFPVQSLEFARFRWHERQRWSKMRYFRWQSESGKLLKRRIDSDLRRPIIGMNH